MSRKLVKTVSNEPVEFICEDEIKLDRNSKDIKQCPIVFVGKKLNRDQQFAIQDMMELKDLDNPKKGVKGMGLGYKYMWNNIIIKVGNVFAPGDWVEGDEKDKLWDTDGMVPQMTEAITHFYVLSSPTDEEVKTSDLGQNSTTSLTPESP